MIKDKEKKPKIVILAKNIDSGTGTVVLQLGELENVFNIETFFLEKARYKKVNHGIQYFSKRPLYRGYYGINILTLLEIVRQFIWFRNVLQKEKPDLIISFNAVCSVIALFCSVGGSKTKLITVHENNVKEVVRRKLSYPLRLILRFIGGSLFKRADAIVCVSKGVASQFKSFYSLKRDIQVIHTGIKSSELKFKRRNKSGLRIISIGRFEEQKDFETIIEAFAKVRSKRKNIQLLLVGDGTKKEALQNLINKLGLNGVARLTGWEQNISQVLSEADVFVLSSYYEGLPVVLLEAMNEGLPIISSNSPFGPSEILEKGNSGILFEVGDRDALTKAILLLIDNPRLRKKFSEKAKERVKFFSKEAMINDYKELIIKTIMQ